MNSVKKVALVLAGCGAKDGAEITESIGLMIALSQANYSVQIFAPDRSFYHVINHITNNVEQTESRNMLLEAARIARGKILPLSKLSSYDFDILCFAGGFGVAKNLCDFAFAGENAKLAEDVKKVLFDFIQAKKIIGALCIAPILLALAAKELKLKNVKLTFGSSDNDAAKIVTQWGIESVEKKVNESCIDVVNKFVTSPAYMDDKASAADIFASATSLVNSLSLC